MRSSLAFDSDFSLSSNRWEMIASLQFLSVSAFSSVFVIRSEGCCRLLFMTVGQEVRSSSVRTLERNCDQLHHKTCRRMWLVFRFPVESKQLQFCVGRPSTVSEPQPDPSRIFLHELAADILRDTFLLPSPKLLFNWLPYTLVVSSASSPPI